MGSADAGPTRDTRPDHGDSTVAWVGRGARSRGARCRRSVGTTRFAGGDARRHLARMGRSAGAASDGTLAGPGTNRPGSDVGKPHVVPAAQCRSDVGIARSTPRGGARPVVGCSAARARTRRTSPARRGVGTSRRVGRAFVESSPCRAIVGAAAGGSSSRAIRRLGCAGSGRAARARSTADGRPGMGRSGCIGARATAGGSGSCLGGAPNRGARSAPGPLVGCSGRTSFDRAPASGRCRSALERTCARVVGGSAACAIDRRRPCGQCATGPGRGARRDAASACRPVGSPAGAGALGPAITSGFRGSRGDDDRAAARRHRDGA